MSANKLPSAAQNIPVSLDSAAFNYRKWREGFTRVLLRIAFALFILAIVSVFQTLTNFERIFYTILTLVTGAIAFAPINYNIRAVFFCALLYLVGVYITLAWGYWADGDAFLVSFVILSSLLFDRWSDIVAIVLSTLTILMVTAVSVSGKFTAFDAAIIPLPPTNNLPSWITFLADFLIISIPATWAISIFKKEFTRIISEVRTIFETLLAERSGLEQRVQERTADLDRSNQRNEERARELRIVADVAQAAASLRDPDALLSQITQIISDRFGYYHTGIFLLDDQREFVVLRAASSEGGRHMLARDHKLHLEPTSIVGYVALSAKPRISSDVGVDAVYFNNPDLPNTHAEMALPLITGEQLIGILDIQSTEPSAFDKEQIEVLTTLANQVAVAIENARLFGQTRQALEESQKIYRQFIAQGWEQYSKTRSIFGYRFDQGRLSSLSAPMDIKSTTAQGSDDGDLALPLRVRNQTIGVLNIRPANARRWSENELNMVRAVVERASLALENARLLDDAQRRSARERSIGEISSRISTFSDVDSIMRSAVEELGRKLGSATEVTLELGNDAQE